ncbi:uncharacterized protein Dwil_GK23971 [Drosophila willistoni]|uniref:RING-type domain-containing protein n=1 Tax=Drosophila willistoni TaxID=7260 RepID=B4N6V0_DROWI|nr:death-associated inhibitor of apoptosis 1 [Drosophila willistoni]XP_046867897.1 death-associated inhibitor of apoptosis 1 [Drosophila willistoni]EDW80089.1 uncharacterized protein Dwil_GK23971 [Drosophila willistoni]
MATNVASKPVFIVPDHQLLHHRPQDQVDNSTNATLSIKSPCRIITMNDKYHREDERLKTFDNWPLSWLDKHQLAQTGMFYTNESDKVKCYFCEVEIGRWEPEDQPVPEHLRFSPNCPLLRRRTTNNVPLNSDALERILPPISYDICGTNDSGFEMREHAYPEGHIQLTQLMQSIGGGVNATTLSTSSSGPGLTTDLISSGGGIGNGRDVQPEPCRPQASYFPEYPEYAVETARVRTFNDWPRHMKQKPQQLAEAGFFYTGVGDRVRCFSCGGGLKDWDENDEPWEQHALWLKDCRFVKLMKGQLYIDSMAAKPKCSSSLPSTPEAASVSEETESSSSQQQLSGDVAPTSTAPSAAARIYDKIVAISNDDTNKTHMILTSSSSTCTSTATSCGAGPSPPNGSATIPEEKLCKICYAAEYNTAFLPCGHVVACAKCASSVTKCPLCRKPFTDVMRVYFS